MTGVICHATVDQEPGSFTTLLYCSHAIDGNSRACDEAPSRFDVQVWKIKSALVAAFDHRLCNPKQSSIAGSAVHFAISDPNHRRTEMPFTIDPISFDRSSAISIAGISGSGRGVGA
jgi:hypothetical protein